MLEFKNVYKQYPNGHEALINVNFTLETGEMSFLTGHSGAGKSTLLKLITRAERCTRGQVLIDGQDLSLLPDKKIPYLRRFMGVVYQSPHLLDDRTVFDNVALPLIISGVRYQEIGRRVRAALDKVGLLNKEKLFPYALSTGEQQRVGIARAIVNKPPFLLADEPTGNLDPNLSAEIMELFDELHQVGVTVLIASHDLTLIACMQHRILHLKHGYLIKDGL